MSVLVDLPDSWVVTTMDEVCNFHAGFGFPTEMQGNSGQDLPFYKVRDVSVAWLAQSAVLLETEHSLSYEDAARIKARPVPEGTVVFAKIGEALRLNRRAIVSRPSLIDNNLMGIDAPPTWLAARYLFWFTLATKFDVDARASVVPSIRKSDVGNLSFPLAPLTEQARIVAKLEELLSDLDAGVAELKAAQKKLAQYRQSLLKAAVEGALTAEWRARHQPAETGAQLLERILTERRARWEAKQLAKFKEQGKAPPKDWKAKYPEPVQPDTTDLPTLPQGWVWASVDMLGEIQGGIQKQPSRAPVKNMYPFLRVANVARSELRLDEVHDIELFPGEFERLALVPGDVLIVEGNGSLTEIGRCAIWDGSVPNAVHQNHLIRVRPIVLKGQWLESWLNSPRGIAKLTELAATTSGLYTLSVGKIARIPVPLAPEPEQAAGVGLLHEELLRQADQRLAIEFALQQSTAQRQNILRAAFTGQLVPQDPNDEPASALLARIRAERAAREAVGKPRGRKAKEAV